MESKIKTLSHTTLTHTEKTYASAGLDKLERHVLLVYKYNAHTLDWKRIASVASVAPQVILRRKHTSVCV